MLKITKDASVQELHIPYGMVEVQYPPRAEWNETAFRDLAEQELSALRGRYQDYDRKAVFGEDLYVRFFKKFKKTYPIMLQFESVMFKGRPFTCDDPVTAVPFLLELTTHILSGTHDVAHIEGGLTLFMAEEKMPFIGLRGEEVHTYPGDFCARDDGGIVFSEIAGVELRSRAREESRHVFYPVFGTPGMDGAVLSGAMEQLLRYIRTLAPTAEIETVLV